MIFILIASLLVALSWVQFATRHKMIGFVFGILGFVGNYILFLVIRNFLFKLGIFYPYGNNLGLSGIVSLVLAAMVSYILMIILDKNWSKKQRSQEVLDDIVDNDYSA